MTNKELQDKLRKFPDDMEVKIELDEYFYAKCASPYKVQAAAKFGVERRNWR